MLTELIKQNKLWLTSYIKLLAPWWHDIPIPDLDSTTFQICGVDRRVVASQYQVLGFPSEIYRRLGLGQLDGQDILEIGPASGYYGLELSQKNTVTSIEAGNRFVRQASFIRDYFHRRHWRILKGKFPEARPDGKYDTIISLGVLYHVEDHTAFCEALRKLSPGRIYLETLISKNGKTTQFRAHEGTIYGESDFETQIVKPFTEYRVKDRIDLTNSSNPLYNQQDHYRSTVILERK